MASRPSEGPGAALALRPRAGRGPAATGAFLLLSAPACARADGAGVTVHPAQNLRVHVERWDATALAEAGLGSATQGAGAAGPAGEELPPPPHVATFTVILELANRPPPGRLRARPSRAPGPALQTAPSPPTAGPEDPLVDPATWTFHLAGRGHRDLPADGVELLAADRFPIAGGGAHWRLALAVTFRATGGEPAPPPGARRGAHAHARDLSPPNTWTLHIRPASDARPRRYALGALARRGFTVRLP